MNSDDIEIIGENVPKNDKLINLLTGDGESSDDEIICLETVFKPASETFKSNTLPPTSKPSYFEDEEEVIDDMLPVSVQNINSASVNKLKPNNLYNVLYTENKNSMYTNGNNMRKISAPPNNVGEPPVKKLKGGQDKNLDSTVIKTKNPSKGKATLESTSQVLTSQNEITETRRYNPLDCKYPVPSGGSMLELIIIILRNAKCLLSGELWDYISGFFPYYEYHFDKKKGTLKTRRILDKSKTFFLKTSSGFLKNTNNKKLLMLNPVTKTEQTLVVEKIKAKKKDFIKSLYVPEIFDSLIEGTLNLSSVKLFHDRKPTSSTIPLTIPSVGSVTAFENTSSVAVANTVTLSPLRTTENRDLTLMSPTAGIQEDHASSSLFVNSLKDADLLDLVDEEERANALSPKSSSSTDTIVFDPKIINCRTLGDDEVEADLLAGNDCEDSSPPTANETGFQSRLLMQLDGIPLNAQGISSESAFANTVWSCEDNSSLRAPRREFAPQPEVNNDSTSFPEMDKCVPKWKEIFPWMEYKPWQKKICCIACQKIHNKLESNTSVVVVEVNHPDDVFKVSKQLRTHAEKNSHKMALILENKAIISTLYFLLNSHFGEFSSIKEILTTFEDLFPSGVNFNQDTLKCTIQMLGEYLEDKIISKLKKLKKFSIITDPCAGILVVRFVNEEDEPEEHIISSYARVIDKTPCDYLASLGVLTKDLIVYVTNVRCEECTRCKATKKVIYRNSTPLRLPSLDKYLVFLWRIKLLKPFYSIGSTLCKLWVSFPHKFTEISKIISIEKLSKFPSNPDSFLEIFQHFEKFREITKSIYLLTGNLEALGFQTIDVSKYNWLLDVFPILTNINILFLEIKSVFPFHKDFDNLFHNAEKLKLFCEKAKENLKGKVIKLEGIDAADIDDLYNIIDLTVKEFQQPIYNKGRSVPLSYFRMTTLKNLNMYKTSANIKNTFIVLYSAIKSNYRYENLSLLLALTNFLKEYPSLEKKDAVAVLNKLKKQSEEDKQAQNQSMKDTENIKDAHNIVYAFYRLMAYYPFQPSKNERCIYETKVYEYLFYRSAWSGIGPNIKDYLLTIIYELSGKQMLSEREILTWWKERVK